MKKGLNTTCYGFFATLANPTRLAILERLDESSMNVTQLAKSMGQEQSMISHNLKPLLMCRFIYSERKGKSKQYYVNKGTMEALFNTVEKHASNHCPFKGSCAQSH
jgi:DNA-binding transcriptional ArsR family regulator